MGKKSSAVAKERRAAQRLEQQQDRNGELLAREYPEDRLAHIRSAVQAAIPGIGASMARKAVDVLCLLQCLQATEAHQSVDYQAIHDELRGELEAQLCGSGFGQWQGQHPFVTCG